MIDNQIYIFIPFDSIISLFSQVKKLSLSLFFLWFPIILSLERHESTNVICLWWAQSHPIPSALITCHPRASAHFDASPQLAPALSPYAPRILHTLYETWSSFSCLSWSIRVFPLLINDFSPRICMLETRIAYLKWITLYLWDWLP